MNSLKDQLLKAGLTDKQTVRDVSKQQQQQTKKPKNKRNSVSASTRQAESALMAKTNQDRELNRQRQRVAEQKATLAQIRQLVQAGKLAREDGEQAYHFTIVGKVKKIYVTDEQKKQLSNDQIAIIVLPNDRFELVPKSVAKKIAERDVTYVITNKIATHEQPEDDDYADYQIPDDLVW